MGGRGGEGVPVNCIKTILSGGGRGGGRRDVLKMSWQMELGARGGEVGSY